VQSGAGVVVAIAGQQRAHVRRDRAHQRCAREARPGKQPCDEQARAGERIRLQRDLAETAQQRAQRVG
jgi:hypothetical protein